MLYAGHGRGKPETGGGGARPRLCAARHAARYRHRLDGAPLRRSARRPRKRWLAHRWCCHLGGNAPAGRGPGHSARHARRNARARPHGRRRRRDRSRPEPDQGRRRGPVARKDRGLRLRQPGGDRRSLEVGVGARPVSASHRSGAVRAGRHAPRRRGGGRRRRGARQGAAAPDQGRPRFRHRWGPLDTRRRARADRRAGVTRPPARRHPRRGRARLVHRACPNGYHRRAGRRAHRRSSLIRTSVDCARRSSMIAPTLVRYATVAALAFGWLAGPAAAQQPGAAAPGAAAPPAAVSPGALAAAKELLTVKGALNMFDPLVPGMVESTKNTFLPTNPGLFKDLNEVAAKLRTEFTPRRNEIVDEIARLYAQRFSEAELKEVIAFYKSPVGKRFAAEEPAVIDQSLARAEAWTKKISEEVLVRFRAEMKKKGHDL